MPSLVNDTMGMRRILILIANTGKQLDPPLELLKLKPKNFLFIYKLLNKKHDNVLCEV